MMDIINKLIKMLEEEAVSDFGACVTPDGTGGLYHALSIAVRLSDSIVDEIGSRPTHSYFHHYRTVNAYLDRVLLKTGLILQQAGWRYIAIPASQSVNENGPSYSGRYSHKKAAVLAGLGTIGRSGLFLHREYGPGVRLGTVFTDCDLSPLYKYPVAAVGCGECGLCVEACPAMAIRGEAFDFQEPDRQLVDAHACSSYMKRHFMDIGRGAVCGICMKICPRRG